jgi:hypothetical protein
LSLTAADAAPVIDNVMGTVSAINPQRDHNLLVLGNMVIPS